MKQRQAKPLNARAAHSGSRPRAVASVRARKKSIGAILSCSERRLETGRKATPYNSQATASMPSRRFAFENGFKSRQVEGISRRRSRFCLSRPSIRNTSCRLRWIRLGKQLLQMSGMTRALDLCWSFMSHNQSNIPKWITTNSTGCTMMLPASSMQNPASTQKSCLQKRGCPDEQATILPCIEATMLRILGDKGWPRSRLSQMLYVRSDHRSGKESGILGSRTRYCARSRRVGSSAERKAMLRSRDDRLSVRSGSQRQDSRRRRQDCQVCPDQGDPGWHQAIIKTNARKQAI